MKFSLCKNPGLDEFIVEDLTPKKVRFRDKEGELIDGMKVDLPPAQPISWKDMLVGAVVEDASKGLVEKEDLVFLEGDIRKTSVNGVPSITFSDRIHQILIQDIENTVILKLLGRNIGFSVLQNKIYSMWKPSAFLHMMDIENGYFLVKFQNKLAKRLFLKGHGPFSGST
ncbi:hypothetical protein J1N35_040890 [Gossypium stocksii]|uniref:DUF4283 domain-containing protein n=1 Tax=Gossypium stocksii TaxID=47602 RepID=A0A9D3ZIS7_9ROSI|nr:hypothetical protein J1N35_040890 [Gossypium stocksii]